MSGNIACIAAVLLGIDVGWQPRPEGGLVYLIQIEPELLDTLKSGDPIQSDFPSKIKNVRGFRITVGRKELPRELPPAEVEFTGSQPATGDPPPTDPFLPSPTGPSNWPDTSVELPPLRQPGSEAPSPPRKIELDPGLKPIEAQQAVYTEQPSADPADESKSPSEGDHQPDESPRDQAENPQSRLIIALFTLFGSMGVNVYLGWITWNTRSRYRALAEGMNLPKLESQ